MNKKFAIEIFGSGAALGKALNISRQAISCWPEVLRQCQSDRVLGAAIRLNKISVAKAKEFVDERQRNKRN